LTNKSSNRRIKPTADTKFHIDYEWWQQDGRDLRTYLLSHLPAEQRDILSNASQDPEVDWIDPETGEVQRVDALRQALVSAAQRTDFVSSHTPMVDAIFRVFLMNGNKPLSSNELASKIGRPSETILRTLSGSAQVYKGLRPVASEE
jgi:hypothetical protein